MWMIGWNLNSKNRCQAERIFHLKSQFKYVLFQEKISMLLKINNSKIINKSNFDCFEEFEASNCD